MERLTEYESIGGHAHAIPTGNTDTALMRFAAYEDTGLTPESVEAIKLHMYDTYDRADFGWDAGCGRYRTGDGLHTKKMKVSGLPSKEKAIEAWNRRADNGDKESV